MSTIGLKYYDIGRCSKDVNVSIIVYIITTDKSMRNCEYAP